jgi:D-psicose/D-tagatose/L-ribulose 3-epimerase
MKIALCNEVLQPLPFARQCALAASLGYDGLEVAPFTLAPNPLELGDAQARDFARIAGDHGLAITGLHWLLVAPAGLSMVSADAALRRQTAAAMVRMVELCAAMGGRYLVHGSPKQRSVPPGESREVALERAHECLAQAAQAAARHGVVYCIEPLSPTETPVLNTVAEAAAVVDRIASPNVRTMFDLSAASQSEHEPPADVLARFLASGHVAHVQLNDRNRRGPGQGNTPVAPVLRALRAADYTGWVALEPFDYQPDPVACAAASAAYVRGAWEAIA